MKKVFIVSKFNNVVRQVYDMLLSDFDVRLGSDKLYVIQGILDIEKPDLILVILNGFDSWHHNIFMKLNEVYPDIPVLCYGNVAEREPFEMHISTYGFHSMEPTSDSAVLNTTILEVLNASNSSEKTDGTSAQISAAMPPSEDNKTEGTKKTILLVDDEPVMLRAVRSLLQEKYKVLMSTSGTEALILLGKQIPDLIILDYNMPVCDGRQTLKMIREFEPSRNIPVVFLTGIGDKAHVEMILKLNPAGYLLKPVNKKTLFNIIEEVLG